jgi:hypothetical protein
MTRRRAIRLSLVALLSLLLGAATTVGVAWWLGRPARVARVSLLPRLYDPSSPGATWEHRLEATGAVWTRSGAGWIQPEHITYMMEAGWPLLAVSSDRRLAEYAAPTVPWRFYSLSKGFGMPLSWQYVHDCLPVQPLWPGFALDTVLYAAAWWALLFTPLPLYRAGRRRFRVSGGMCGGCGYSLAGSPGGACPECGQTVGAEP